MYGPDAVVEGLVLCFPAFVCAIFCLCSSFLFFSHDLYGDSNPDVGTQEIGHCDGADPYAVRIRTVRLLIILAEQGSLQ